MTHCQSDPHPSMGETSLKQVLKDFLSQYEAMEASRETDHDRYLEQFHSLKDLTESLRRNPEYQCSEGLKEVNRRKNRYKDILPYDNSRVIISEYPGVPGSDYINANYVKGSTGSSRAYICSQGECSSPASGCQIISVFTSACLYGLMRHDYIFFLSHQVHCLIHCSTFGE